MIRIIDLDALGKFLQGESAVHFSVHVDGNQYALPCNEVADLVRARVSANQASQQGAAKGGKKAGKGASASPASPARSQPTLDGSSAAAGAGDAAHDDDDSPAGGDGSHSAESRAQSLEASAESAT